MKCPDCGTKLSDAMFGSLFGHRCYKCGGFWADSKVVNNLPESVLKNWRRIKIDPMWLSGGKGICPQDGTMLQNYIGDEIPGYLVVKRCVRCGKWWFPGDSLFEYRAIQAGQPSINRPADDLGRFTGVILPVVVVFVLLSGLAVALVLAQQRQLIMIPAFFEKLITE